MKGNFATLEKSSPFYPIFENGNAPIKNWLLPNKASLEGSDETEVYMLDITRCTAEQIEAVAHVISAKFGAAKDEIVEQMKTRGMPIRASQVATVWSDIPAFL
jgi:hypothetical protein